MASHRNRFSFISALLALAVALLAGPALAQSELLGGFEEPYPLRAADTTSPRDTLRSFLRDFSEGVDAWRADRPRSEILRPMMRAADTLDTRDITALGRESALLIDMSLLREVLDRVELPQFEDIPGDAEVAADEELTRWVVPNTRIEIVKVAEGPDAGQFLFSRETVDRIRLAGAFGSHIDVKYAMVLGLIPDCDLAAVNSVGNAAGTGARIALLDRKARAEIEEEVRKIEKVETAVEPRFQDHFVEAMAFPHKTAPFPNLRQVVALPEPRAVQNQTGQERRRSRRGNRVERSTEG